MVSHPKIETLWVPKGKAVQDNTTEVADRNSNHHRLHLPRLRNLLSALNFEHHLPDNTTNDVPNESIPSPPPPPPPPPQQQQQSQQSQRTSSTPVPIKNRIFCGSRIVPSFSKVLRGSMIANDDDDVPAGKSGVGGNSSSNDSCDIFYDAYEYGNSPDSPDDFLPETESPRESIVLAGIVVTSVLSSPQHRIEGGIRHPNIETVLPSSRNNINENGDDHFVLHKSIEYTEQEYSTNIVVGDEHDTELPNTPSSRSILSTNDDRNNIFPISYPPAAPPAPAELPLRFLRAGKNDPVVGIQRYQATLQMRQEQKIDTILREPSEKFHIIKQHYPHYCHYRGKNNEPCFYEQPPKTNLRELRKNGVTLEKLLRHYTMVTEYQWQYIERDDLARSIYIIDLDGIRMTDFVGEAVDFVKKASAFSAQHYPERAGYVFVINVPGWFKLIWNVVKPIIDEDTLKKIYILRGKDEIRTAMQERIPLEHIPPEYGGTSLPLGQSPQEVTLAEWIEHNNILAAQERTVCRDCSNCQFCTWIPARSY